MYVYAVATVVSYSGLGGFSTTDVSGLDAICPNINWHCRLKAK